MYPLLKTVRKACNQCNGNEVFPSKFRICEKALLRHMKYALIDYFPHRGVWQILWWWSLEHGINSRGYDHGIHTWIDIILSWIKIHFVISNIVNIEIVFFFNFVVDHLSFFMICSNLVLGFSLTELNVEREKTLGTRLD